MPPRKRSRPTLRERGKKPAHRHSSWAVVDEVECGWCEHQKWETFQRTLALHDLTFNRYIIQEEPW